jgi:hypothetical protein
LQTVRGRKAMPRGIWWVEIQPGTVCRGWESFAPPSGCGSLFTRFPRVGAFAPTRGYRLQRLRRWGSSSGVWELATGTSSSPTPARGPVVPEEIQGLPMPFPKARFGTVRISSKQRRPHRNDGSRRTQIFTKMEKDLASTGPDS